MISLYRNEDSPSGHKIETKLKDLVLAHQVTLVTAQENTIPLPHLKENGNVIVGDNNIAVYLKDLEKFVRDWGRFQSDACYCDED